MHLYAIVIVAVVLAADGLSIDAGLDVLPGWQVTGVALGAPAFILLVLQVFVAVAMRRARRGHSMRAIVTAGQVGRLARGAMVLHHGVVVLGLGWLTVIRHWTGDLILVDELIAMLPPLLGLAASWWIDYPAEKRLRDAMLIRRLDRGAPIYDTPGRGGHVLMQLRLQLLPLLAPLLLIAAFGEVIRLAASGVNNEDARFWIGEAATLVAAGGVFVIAPLLARVLLSVRRLPDGELRTALLDVCRTHRVGVREILVWDTGGVMINAAVMGLVAPLRYIMLTDALLDAMDRRELIAVMAHEIGHVRRHHMPWMVIALLAVLTAASIAVTGPMTVLWMIDPALLPDSQVLDVGATGATLLLAFIMFGWISRRFERQADTFAAQHLSLHGLPEEPSVTDGDEATIGQDAAAVAATDGRVTARAVWALQRALQLIASLNMIDPNRRSWRHGSIHWRQQYLASLIGQPADALSIDRQVRWLKVSAAIVLIAGIGLQALLWSMERNDMSGVMPMNGMAQAEDRLER